MRAEVDVAELAVDAEFGGSRRVIEQHQRQGRGYGVSEVLRSEHRAHIGIGQLPRNVLSGCLRVDKYRAAPIRRSKGHDERGAIGKQDARPLPAEGADERGRTTKQGQSRGDQLLALETVNATTAGRKREWEEREFRKHISDWELSRYFEII